MLTSLGATVLGHNDTLTPDFHTQGTETGSEFPGTWHSTAPANQSQVVLVR